MSFPMTHALILLLQRNIKYYVRMHNYVTSYGSRQLVSIRTNVNLTWDFNVRSQIRKASLCRPFLSEYPHALIWKVKIFNFIIQWQNCIKSWPSAWSWDTEIRTELPGICNSDQGMVYTFVTTLRIITSRKLPNCENKYQRGVVAAKICIWKQASSQNEFCWKLWWS